MRPDPRYEEGFSGGRLRPPPIYHEGPHGYHSDNETAFEARSRFPSHLEGRRRVSSPGSNSRQAAFSREQRVPSPPPSRRTVFPEARERSEKQRVLSSADEAAARMVTYASRVPSPPPSWRPKTFDRPSLTRRAPSPPWPPPLDSRKLSFEDHILPRPRTPELPYTRIDAGYLSPPNRENSSLSGGDRAHGLRRWNSERGPNSRATTSTPLVEGALPNRGAASVAPTDSTFRLSRPSTPGTLGNQVYHYRALHNLEFRLVKIFPERRTMIKCEITHASLGDPPRYIAISYAWGDAGNTRKIDLEGSLIPIAVSLYGALEALRQKAEFVLVWVDALCIDQQNRDERTQQVGLMTSIYSTAKSVAIWLGPEEDDSALAIRFLCTMAERADSPTMISQLISSRGAKRDLAAVVSLFERDYWRRLWVVQEILNARDATVYCGSAKHPWSIYLRASHAFRHHRGDLDSYFPVGRSDGERHIISPNQFSYSQALVYQGPNSLPELESYGQLREGSLLEVLRACRRKLASDARDKLFGILGILPTEVRKEFRADYSLSVKDVYTEVVDYLLKTTDSIDVICEAIHFPFHTNSANLPSYVPDWSHVPQTSAMGYKYNFSAAGVTKASCRFLDERLTKLEISAVYLDTISIQGIAVGTICTLADYLMAFLHWRALLLKNLEKEKDEHSLLLQEDFCKTLSLGQVPPAYSKSKQWLIVCYHIFASLLKERLPYLPLDGQMRKYVDAKLDNISPEARRQYLQQHFGNRMMGRCFCLTKDDRMGMGSGLMLPGDIVVVPLGCSTPILLRLEGRRGEYRFIGDVYINGYMRGRAVDQWQRGERELRKYVLH